MYHVCIVVSSCCCPLNQNKQHNQNETAQVIILFKAILCGGGDVVTLTYSTLPHNNIYKQYMYKVTFFCVSVQYFSYCTEMKICYVLELFVLFEISSAARHCNETQSRLFLEQVTKKDISYVEFHGSSSCYVKFANSER